MRTLLHLSDLHFGRIDEAVVGPLADIVQRLAPDVVAVSGDLTQRARAREFRAARAFLDGLPSPQIVVPGNHDVPLYDALTRVFRPLGRYRRYITDDLQPAYLDDEIAVVGVSTARALPIKGGRINERQVEWVRGRLARLDGRVVKVVVSHHPFDVPEEHPGAALVDGAWIARERLARCGVDLFLAGHLHAARAGPTAARKNARGRRVVVVQAGTATSTRGRGEANSFNLLRIEAPEVVLERFDWHPERQAFAPGVTERFRRGAGGWSRVR